MRIQWKALGSNWHVDMFKGVDTVTPGMVREIAHKRGVPRGTVIVFGPAQH